CQRTPPRISPTHCWSSRSRRIHERSSNWRFECMTRGLVSVIIPTYNRADYVVEAIRSAQAQTYRRTQIIVVDDGSCDDTARRVSEVGGVEYHYQINRGQGAARNNGLRLARGEYVASLDSDDL